MTKVKPWQFRNTWRRLVRAEALMYELIQAHDANEMSRYQAALSAVREFLREA